VYQQGTPGSTGLWGPAIGAAGTVAAAKVFVMCLPSSTEIDTPEGRMPIESLRAGDSVDGGVVLFKNEYAPQSTVFVKIVLSDGRSVESCDNHIIDGKPAITHSVGDSIAGGSIINKEITIRTERTYDILTSANDGGYFSSGIPVATMIPTLHRIANELEAINAYCD
jgi:hypothetical protein